MRQLPGRTARKRSKKACSRLMSAMNRAIVAQVARNGMRVGIGPRPRCETHEGVRRCDDLPIMQRSLASERT